MENLRLGGRGDLSRLDGVLELLPALRPLLSRYDFVLHGHTHKNTFLDAANTRIFGTASGSAGNASFRQFDVDQTDHGWQISIRVAAVNSIGFGPWSQWHTCGRP